MKSLCELPPLGPAKETFFKKKNVYVMAVSATKLKLTRSVHVLYCQHMAFKIQTIATKFYGGKRERERALEGQQKDLRPGTKQSRPRKG